MKNDGPVYGTCQVRNGRMRIVRTDVLSAQLATLRDGVYEIALSRKRATRSVEQNAWYWSCLVGFVAEHTGYSPDDVHEIYKAKFLPKKLAMCDGNGVVKDEFVIGGTTTKLTTADFSEYCEAIRKWAAEELQVVIPDPR